jgi:hypothetical protein
MIYRISKITITLLVAVLVVISALSFLTNVSTELTDSDIAVFRTVLHLDNSQDSMSYAQELHLINKIQNLVLREAYGNAPIPEYSSREPEDLFKSRSGLCFDRSRTLDKIFKWYGFETRHIFILYDNHPETGETLSFWSAFFTHGIDSHAVTEVKTSRGWLVVDSNTLWISVATDGNPVDADQIALQVNRFASIPEYWTRPFWAIRGLYSRRGQFYPPYIPYPELNWHDFISWLVAG